MRQQCVQWAAKCNDEQTNKQLYVYRTYTRRFMCLWVYILVKVCERVSSENYVWLWLFGWRGAAAPIFFFLFVCGETYQISVQRKLAYATPFFHSNLSKLLFTYIQVHSCMCMCVYVCRTESYWQKSSSVRGQAQLHLKPSILFVG